MSKILLWEILVAVLYNKLLSRGTLFHKLEIIVLVSEYLI